MLQFNKVILHNFGSYGHAEIELCNKGFCLVTGKNNFKKDNALSNGSGKSFLWSAICFAITGETINGLHSNLKNINSAETDNECYVSLDFNANNDVYHIIRTIEPSSDLKIFKNDENVSGKGIRASEKKLAELLPDLTKDLIASTIIIGQGMPNKFSSFSPSGRKELLEKLTKSDFMIDDLKKRVNSRMAEINSKIREYEDSLLVNNTQLSSKKTILLGAQNTLAGMSNPNFDAEITETELKIAAITKDLEKANIDYTKSETELETTNNLLVSETNEKLNLSTQEFKAYSDATGKINGEKIKLNSQISALSQEILRLKSIKDVCPTCGQKLVGVVKPSTEVQEAQLAEFQKQLVEVQSNLDAFNLKHQNYITDINNNFDSTIAGLKAKITVLKKDIGKYKDNINDFTHYLSIENEKLAKLKYTKLSYSDSVKSLQKTISTTEEEIARIESLINITDLGKTELLERLAVIKKMDTLLKRDFRGYLLINIIKYIDKRAKDYCEIVFGTRELNVYLDGNALDITYCNKMFDNLSGGEKQRVDLILQFAIRDMLMKYLNINSNILVLDEITDFLDKQSCKSMMTLVEKELNTIESVFIISHHAEELELPIDSEIHVVKNENGISEVY